MKVMILAAGFGNRMRPLTDTTPKPLLRAGKCSLIEWHLRRLARRDFRDVVINTHHLGDKLRDALGDGSRFGLRIHWSPEADILETAGGIRQALPLLGDQPFAVINGDVWTDYDFTRLRRALPEGLLGRLVMVPNAAHHPAGDFHLDAAGLLSRDGPGQRHTYSGMAVFDPALFRPLPPGRLPLADVLRPVMEQDRLAGELFSGDWQDIGTPERLRQLNERLAAGNCASNGR